MSKKNLEENKNIKEMYIQSEQTKNYILKKYDIILILWYFYNMCGYLYPSSIEKKKEMDIRQDTKFR